VDKDGKTALHLAMESKKFSRVEILLEFGAGMFSSISYILHKIDQMPG
jgi:ankyrin repeat protein